MKLANKVVVIIGGSRGFGRALAKLFKDEGSCVVIVSKNQTSAEQAAQELGATAFVADVRNEQNLRDVAESVMEKFGKIDVWINSAGVLDLFRN